MNSNSNTTKLISPERVEELFDCYGANPDAWPDDERATALTLIENSSQLQGLQREAKQLDRFLVSGENQQEINAPVDSKLVARIVDYLPEQHSSRQPEHSKRPLFDLGDWFGSKWIGMAAASIAVVVISVSIMNLQTISVPQDQPVVIQAELEEWMWEQVTGETDNEEDEPISFMTLL